MLRPHYWTCLAGICLLLAGFGCGDKPAHNANWYYYWEKDNVIPGLDRDGSPASRWDWSTTLSNYGAYGAGHGPSDGYVLTDFCITEPVSNPITVTHQTMPWLVFPIGATTQFGIEQAAATMTHEKQHITNYKFRILPGQTDSEPDGLADFEENKYPYYFVIGLRDTYDLATAIGFSGYADYGDDEFIARQAEPAGVAVAKKDEDWSKGGAQWGH